jgi:hypothetical protein
MNLPLFLCYVLCVVVLNGCGTLSRLSEVGRDPAMTPRA